MTDERRVWVGCLACYNAGDLTGEWREPYLAPDWACGRPGHEETWIFDHEGFGPAGEMSPAEAAALDEWMSGVEHLYPEIPGPVLYEIRREYGEDFEFDGRYCGCWPSR